MREGVAEEESAIAQHIAYMLVDTLLTPATMLLRHGKTHRRYVWAGIVLPANVERLASMLGASTDWWTAEPCDKHSPRCARGWRSSRHENER